MILPYYNKHMMRLTANSIIKATPIEELEDYWHSFNESIDMNFYIEDNKLKVLVYDVIEGMTVTSDFFVLFEQAI
jgi:hypothetical protein